MAALSEITALVFGEQARAWSKRLLSAYELVVPMLESKKEVEQVKGREEGAGWNLQMPVHYPTF
ncbi:hypothetical protein [Teredinibacter franksiae]|uniref:hypothetical protein n=1 Tax=Teredinibacter franksiae TaxID=2761453 RepID=UPI00162601D1|nr:hypothetical protein [Teredinibacter franksiae]